MLSGLLHFIRTGVKLMNIDIDLLILKYREKIEEMPIYTPKQYHKQHIEYCLLNMLIEHKDKLPDFDDYFHKAFRQCDVTESGHHDMVFWHLLNTCSIFWVLFEKFTKKNDVQHSAKPYVCSVCGGKFVGDGYTTVQHCENVDPPDYIEPDAPPIECEKRQGENNG